MQILYAIPFVLASCMAFILFVSIPRLRRYALPALVAPAVFGVCGLFMLAVDTHYDSLPRIVAIAAPLLVYLGSGVAGAWLAIAVLQFVMKRFREHS